PLPGGRSLMQPELEDRYWGNQNDCGNQQVDQRFTTTAPAIWQISGKYGRINGLGRGRLRWCGTVARTGHAHLLRRLRSNYAHWGDESVATTSYGLDEPRIGGGVAQGVAQLADRSADAALEINEGILRP